MHKTNMDAHMNIENSLQCPLLQLLLSLIPSAALQQQHQQQHCNCNSSSSNKEAHQQHFAFSYLKQFTLATFCFRCFGPPCLSFSFNKARHHHITALSECCQLGY